MSESGEDTVYRHSRNGSTGTSCHESDAEDFKSYTSLTNETDSGVSNTGSIDSECVPKAMKNGTALTDENIMNDANGHQSPIDHTTEVASVTSNKTDNVRNEKRHSLQHEALSNSTSYGAGSGARSQYTESAPNTPNGSLRVPSRSQRQQKSVSPPHQQRHISPSTSSSLFGRYGKKSQLNFTGTADTTAQSMVAASSTTGLILQGRPKELPAKSPEEEKRHTKMYREIMAAARRKELQKAKDEQKREVDRREKDKQVAASLVEWNNILSDWDRVYKRRTVQELWWKGLPPGVRGKVWMKAIGNDLNITHELYQIFLSRCKSKMAELEKAGSVLDQDKGIDREQSVEVIGLDVLRTFPNLGFFQEGGPYYSALHDVLGAYACYRPDIGYVQGMSFLAAVLLLNMEAPDAFICLANLLNRPSYVAFFKVDHALMKPYFNAFSVVLQETLPRLSAYFTTLQFSPEFYLIEWIFTLYTKVLPLDTSCRVWDVFCRDGDSFLFRTALGILKLGQKELTEFESIAETGQFLGKFTSDLSSEALFESIASVPLSSKHFQQLLQQQTGPSR